MAPVKARMTARLLRSAASSRNPGYVVSIAYCSPPSAVFRFSSAREPIQSRLRIFSSSPDPSFFHFR
jgi:hypothetical protein